MPRVSELGAELDYEFADETLLSLAVTHRSWCAEHGITQKLQPLVRWRVAVLGTPGTMGYGEGQQGLVSELIVEFSSEFGYSWHQGCTTRR